MDRVQFVGSISNGISVNDQYFDQAMIAYSLIGDINDISTSAIPHLNGSISFKFIIGNKDDYEKLMYNVANSYGSVDMYGSSHNVELVENCESNLSITIRIS